MVASTVRRFDAANGKAWFWPKLGAAGPRYLIEVEGDTVMALKRLPPASLLTGTPNRRGSMFGADSDYRVGCIGFERGKIQASAYICAERKGHSCQKSETTRNDRAFIA